MRQLMQRARLRVEALKGRVMALVPSLVAEMVMAMPRWRERILLH